MTFCSTSLPLAALDGFDRHYQDSVHCSKQCINKSQQHQGKNSWVGQESNPGGWVQSENALHCAMRPTNENVAYFENLVKTPETIIILAFILPDLSSSES